MISPATSKTYDNIHLQPSKLTETLPIHNTGAAAVIARSNHALVKSNLHTPPRPSVFLSCDLTGWQFPLSVTDDRDADCHKPTHFGIAHRVRVCKVGSEKTAQFLFT